MCILCGVQRWSRRVATMLPWLVLPLILLWALSQLLPAAYRFEVTSPRLACVSVLLLTLFWYEILLPRLSLWRARRSARLREERRAHALQLHKLRKTATRRCRNCANPYRDQNPQAGKFMCSYCGHVSKRPVLDLGAAGKAVVPPAAAWGPCAQDWANAAGGGGDPGYWLDLRCSSDNLYSGFSWRLFSCFCISMRWFWRKVFRFGSSGDEDGSGRDGKRLAKGGENGEKAEESRVEKAKRKAEEKKLARLEREMLEEEERKQREEMAKLVEERRKLRDEKADAEERSKGATPVGEKDAKKEAERKRCERKRKEEKDKGSSKSNSDCEDIERRVGREGEKKRDFDRRNEPDKRDATRAGAEGYKLHNFEANQGSKIVQGRAKYFGRMTGSLLSSSRGFGGSSFFGRSAQTPAPQLNKATKPLVTATGQTNVVKRDGQQPATAKSDTVGEIRNSWTDINRPVSPNVQPHPTGLKKSWHQLFSRSASVSPCPDTTASAHEKSGHPELNGGQISNAQVFLSQYPPLDTKANSSRSMQFPGFPPVNGLPANMSRAQFPAGHMPYYSEPEPTLLEEPEQFEDPCYDPDAIALLGPVSESLDNFPPDFDSGFISSGITKEPHVKPSPIESPLSRSRIAEEKPIRPSHSIANGTNGSILPEAGNDQGTWQMWSTPLVQDSLGLRGPQAKWLLPNTNQFNHDANHLNGGTRIPLSSGLDDNGSWMQKTPFQQLPPDTGSLFSSHDVSENTIHNHLGFGSPNISPRAHPFGPPGHPWSKEALVLNGPQEAGHMCSPSAAHVGGSFFSANPDVQSLWSFSENEKTYNI